MLSTLSNLLPALSSQDKQDDKPDAPPAEPPSARPSEAAQDDAGERRARDRARVQNETFIIVRPPPAINNHPLNLQLQLIPPAVHAHGKDRSTASTSSRRSVDFTGTTPEQLPDAEPDSNALRRSPSVTSSRSDATSLYSSPSSVGSVSSFGSSASSRRIIVPLYNLSAHNVMTNAVLDAGTDARIAKFLKRGVELIDLCVLEPTEIWQSRNPTVDNASLQLPSPAHGDRIGSPAPSMTSADRQSLEVTPQPAAAAAAVAKRSRFSSLFNRKDANNRSASLAAPATPTDSPTAKKRASTSPAPQAEHLSAPVLGLQASVFSAVHPPTGKSPASIVWVVRKWIKGSDSSLLGNLRASTRKGQDAAAAAVPTVRFEWVRSAARSGTGDTHSRYATDVTAADSRRSSRIVSPAGDATRPSQPGSPKSVDFAPLPHPEHPAADAVSHDEAASATTATTDAGDESDPEDSETPWTCTLVISLPGNVSPSPSDSSNDPSKRLSLASTDNAHAQPPPHPSPLHPGAGGSFRLRLATLSPTPHHPKVVAQLKIPWPLPDVDVVQGVAHKRSPGGRPSPPAGAGLLVTAEEMKDVVCTTAFWMIVREGFGGVGRKTRKGDGWRIRG